MAFINNILRHNPVKYFNLNSLPTEGQPGSYWENRLDRNHCGIDIYAPVNSEVYLIENGVVIETGLFTSPNWVNYWNNTYYVLIKHDTGFITRYAEMSEVSVKQNQIVEAGEIIGKVGQVLNYNKIDSTAPLYIQKLKEKNNCSMLHFELHNYQPNVTENYLAGNLFNTEHALGLLDPTNYLKSIL